MLKIHSIETFGTHEGPGIRVVLFTQGCKMKCLYCHNPDTIPMKGDKYLSEKEILELLEKSKPYFGNKGGITISGGECLIYADKLIPIFKKIKNLGYHTAIDTNGYIFNEDVEKLLKYTDLVLLDIKHLYKKEHKILTGVSNENILKFADYLKQINKSFWIRHVLVPGYTDCSSHIEDIGKYFKDFENLERFEILPYHTLGVHKWEEMGWEYGLKGISSPTKENLLKAKKLLEKSLKKVLIRG